MLTTKQKGLLEHIITHCETIKKKTELLTLEQLSQDEDIKQIICFNILQIGELVGHLDESFLTQYSEMPWGDMRGMRNRVVHGYDTIDINEVWITATKDITPLLNYCNQLLQEDK